MKRTITILLVILLFAVLAAIRFFQEQLFYDPLLDFFKYEYMQDAGLPSYEMSKLLLFTGLRYWLNTMISLLVLWVCFRESTILKFALIIYMLAFIVLLGIFIFLLNDYEPSNYLTLFYVRRFLIQPLLIILLLPAFYYQRKRKV